MTSHFWIPSRPGSLSSDYRVVIQALALVFIFLCFLVPPTASSNIQLTGCRDEVLELSCPMYHRIAIKRVFYGVKQGLTCRNVMDSYINPESSNTFGMMQNPASGINSTKNCCVASHTDCFVYDDSKYPALNTACSGLRHCKVRVKRVSTGSRCIYRAYTDYMSIIYNCVAQGDIAHFCTDDNKRGQVLHLTNEEYPSYINPPRDGAECQCMVKSYNTVGIHIQSVDVLLTWAKRGPRECRRILKIRDPMTYERKIQCAHRGFYGYRTIYRRAVSNVTVTLSSLAGSGIAYVWLKVKAFDPNGVVGILCGKSLQDALDDEKRHEELLKEKEKQEKERKTEEELEKVPLSVPEDSEDDEEKEEAGSGKGSGSREVNNSTAVMPSTVSKGGLSSDMAYIIGGIVAVGFVLIVIVIIAIALHCRRIHRDKRKQKPLELYPALTSEPLDLSSYCKYDYDVNDHHDHLCTISRSNVKMVNMLDDPIKFKDGKHNGFITVATAEEYHVHKDPSPPSPPLPAGISTPPPSTQNQPLMSQKSYREVHYPGNLSLRFVKPIVNNGHENVHPDYSSDHEPPTVDVHGYNNPYQHNGHTTLPAKTVLIHSGPKSPLGKRSKSVTFSQPVAMVTPLNSESEESMESRTAAAADVNHYDHDDVCGEEPSYDNLQQVAIPDKPLMPGKTEFISIPRWEKEIRGESPPRPLSTFQGPSSPDEVKMAFPPPPPIDYNVLYNDPRLTPESDDTAYMSDKDSNSTSSSFWSPTKQKSGKPTLMPKPQKAQLYETGV